MTTNNNWERVASEGRTIYWRRPTTGNRRCTVSRAEGGWQWKLFSTKERSPNGGDKLIMKGQVEKTVQTARARCDEKFPKVCP